MTSVFRSCNRRVAVIGGGPAGLIAYKQLVDAGVVPTLFSRNIGGMWNVKTNPFWPAMKTNLSSFTCRFSDLQWPQNTPLFPSQVEMNQYLDAYATKHLKPESTILGCNVTHINTNGDGQYTIEWIDSSKVSKSEVFDDVVVTTGFFAKPSAREYTGFNGRIIHSSQYTNPDEFAGRNVVVAGASFSAAEIASDVATTANSVRSVVPRPSWIIPRFLPLHLDKPNTPFLPVDLLFYQLNPKKDTVEHRQESIFKLDKDRTRTNGYFRLLLGPHDSDDVMAQMRAEEAQQASSQAADGHATHSVPAVHSAISDNYATMVKAGLIEVVRGYVHSASENSVVLAPHRPAHAEHDNNNTTVLHDVDDLIVCTGFTPALDFLDSSILTTIGFNEEETLQPLLLHRDVMHPDLPGLYFVGMYRGPYFAGVELQASAVAAYISGHLALPTASTMQEGVEMSQQIRQQVPRPQFPHGDYIGMSLAWMRELGLSLHPAPAPASGPPAPVSAAGSKLISLPESGSYVFSPDMLAPVSELPAATQDSIARVMAECNQGRHLSQTIFRALQGDWAFERTLISQLDSSPSGTVVGKISLFRGDKGCSDLVYVEKGRFTTSRGMSFDVNGSQYVYVLNEEEDCIDIFFADKETGRIRERIFVSLRVTGRDEDGWIAVGEPHLCGKDTYIVRFKLAFQGLALQKIEIQIDVKGPFKDYQSNTVLTKFENPKVA